jgi:hypothetical protein
MRLVSRSLDTLRQSFSRVIRADFIESLVRANFRAARFTATCITATRFIAIHFIAIRFVTARRICRGASLIGARFASLAFNACARRVGFRFVPAEIFHVSGVREERWRK